jgi:outer membrane lipoprotein carrier protein
MPPNHNPRRERGAGRRRACRGAMLAAAALALMLTRGARVSADAPDVKEFVHQLESSYKGVHTLKADFTQIYQWGERTRQESGTVYFAHGGRMRWDYDSPEKKLFISNGKDVLLYVPEQKQMTRTTVKASEDVRVPFRLLLSRVDLGKVFEHIEFADDALQAQPGDRVLRAIPKHGDESGIHEVLLEVTPDFDIRTLVVFYVDHGKMTFRFQDMKRNARTTPELFEFQPPPGTQIIEQK